MKYLLFLVLARLFAAAAPALSQNRKTEKGKAKRPPRTVKKASNAPNYELPPAPPPTVEEWKAQQAAKEMPPPLPADDLPPPPPKPRPIIQKPSSDVLKEIAIGEWGATSVLIPQDLIEITNLTDKKVNGKISWTTYSRSWKLRDAGFLEGLEIDLWITTWDNRITEIIPELRPDLATPEHLVLIDLLGDLKVKNTPGSFVQEAKAMEIDHLNGSYFRAVLPSADNRFRIGWSTHRYYNGKPQNVTLAVSGGAGELDKALKILQSLRLEAAK